MKTTKTNRRRLELAVETMINKYVGLHEEEYMNIGYEKAMQDLTADEDKQPQKVDGLTPEEQRSFLEVTDPITTKLSRHVPEAIREWLHRDRNNPDKRALIWGPYDPEAYRVSTKGQKVMNIEIVYQNGPTRGLVVKEVLVNGKKAKTGPDHYGGDSWVLVEDKEHSQDLTLNHNIQ